jgi:hypothetical protein
MLRRLQVLQEAAAAQKPDRGRRPALASRLGGSRRLAHLAMGGSCRTPAMPQCWRRLAACGWAARCAPTRTTSCATWASRTSATQQRSAGGRPAPPSRSHARGPYLERKRFRKPHGSALPVPRIPYMIPRLFTNGAATASPGLERSPTRAPCVFTRAPAPLSQELLPPPPSTGFTVLRVPLRDVDDEDIATHFAAVTDFIQVGPGPLCHVIVFIVHPGRSGPVVPGSLGPPCCAPSPRRCRACSPLPPTAAPLPPLPRRPATQRAAACWSTAARARAAGKGRCASAATAPCSARPRGRRVYDTGACGPCLAAA